MEKQTPHYNLSVVKQLIKAGHVSSTQSALTSATSLGFDFNGMCVVINALTSNDFYKSMTTHANHRIWQDVYRPATDLGEIYLKLTILDDVLIVSFKEL
jgi:motility quorum-sensing regulator/GCU-specific mRNA interferase toxin